MSDLKRLVDEGGLGATLLASARGDAPAERARDRAAEALGLSAGALVVTTSGTAAGGAATTAAGGAAAKTASAAVWMKVLAIGIVSTTVAGGAVVGVHELTSPPRTAPASAASAPSAPRAAVERPSAEPAPVADAPPIPAPSAPAPAVVANGPRPTVGSSPRQVVTSMPFSKAESPLARELRLLDLSRAALDHGDSSGALAALDEYERAFPQGSLRTEAAVLRVEALRARGDTEAAQKLARDLLARDAAGPHARHLRSILESEAPK